ncbi:MAG: glycosyltransferase family 1 protein, partial [Clostridia bacterium]|nr:glycosyltransferase family 1 protein [Clostridia bacterium]
MDFFYSLVPELINAGHTVDIACNTSLRPVNEQFLNLGCKVYPISCTRSPISKKTFTAIKELKKIVSDGEYDLVHCY